MGGWWREKRRWSAPRPEGVVARGSQPAWQSCLRRGGAGAGPAQHSNSRPVTSSLSTGSRAGSQPRQCSSSELTEPSTQQYSLLYIVQYSKPALTDERRYADSLVVEARVDQNIFIETVGAAAHSERAALPGHSVALLETGGEATLLGGVQLHRRHLLPPLLPPLAGHPAKHIIHHSATTWPKSLQQISVLFAFQFGEHFCNQRLFTVCTLVCRLNVRSDNTAAHTDTLHVRDQVH